MEKSIIKICVIAAGAICFIGQIAGAEGGDKRATGDWGVNRRVITQAGYTEVSGTFTVNSLVIPKDVNGKITPRSNYADDKPTFYLGCTNNLTNGTEVDAGLQYETRIQGNNIDGYFDRGWSIVFSKSGVYTTIRKQTIVNVGGSPQRVFSPWRGAENEYSLSFKVWPGDESIDDITPSKGTVSLYVGGDFKGTVFYKGNPPSGGTSPERPTPTNIEVPGIGAPEDTPDGSPLPAITEDKDTVTLSPPTNALVSPGPTDNPDVVYGSTPLSNIRVKRVVGITQAKPFKAETEGSNFSCTFSGGALKRYDQSTSHSWDPRQNSLDVEQSQNKHATGYDTNTDGFGDDPAKNHLVDHHPTSGSTYKVSFPGLTVTNDDSPREDTHNSRAATFGSTDDSRYTHETVAFDLGYAARPWGFIVVPRK